MFGKTDDFIFEKVKDDLISNSNDSTCQFKRNNLNIPKLSTK